MDNFMWVEHKRTDRSLSLSFSLRLSLSLSVCQLNLQQFHNFLMQIIFCTGFSFFLHEYTVIHEWTGRSVMNKLNLFMQLTHVAPQASLGKAAYITFPGMKIKKEGK